MSSPTRPTALRRPASLRPAAPRRSPLPASVALSLGAALLAPLAAQAQTATAAAAKPETELAEVKTRAQAIDPNPNATTGVPYKAKTSGDPRHTRPLAETPQTIQVVTKKAIDESGSTDLRAILDAQPGITLGTGENGNAFGDRYIIRGQEARSDVFVDGLRDPGMTIRESFAVDQVEVTKGPNSSFAGRGTAGGAINAITKQATLDRDITSGTAALGSSNHLRGTLDVNKIFTDQLAVRVNALWAEEDVPGRAPASRKRNGLAVSGTYEFKPDRDLTLDYYRLRAQDRPDLGTWLVGSGADRLPERKAPVYLQDEDFLKSDVEVFTARLRWAFNDQVRLNSLTRRGDTSNGYIATSARASTAYSGTGSASPYATVSLGSHNGWQDVEYLAHQSNLTFTQPLFGRKNAFILGFEFSDHKALRGSYSGTQNAANCRTSATATANNAYCITDTSGALLSNLGNVYGRNWAKGMWVNDWRVRTFALSAMDTLDLTDRWSVFSGVRADRFKFQLNVRNATTGLVANNSYEDTLLNYHGGLTFKLAPGGIVYASTASAADINGGESDAGTSAGYGGAVIYNGTMAAKPERSRNLELGTKWDLFDGKLLATAAVFQTTKRDVMEGANYDTFGTFNTGSSRIRGLELGLVGAITPKLSLQAGYAWMKSRVLASATATNVGRPLANLADQSGNVQLKYQATDQIAVGAAAKYEGQRCVGQPDTAPGYTNGLCSQPLPAYTTFDAFASFRLNRHLDLRVNALNLGDKDYYLAGYRSGAILYKGDGRALRVTAEFNY